MLLDKAFAETGTLPLTGVTAFALLGDGSILATTVAGTKRETHHVVGTAVKRTYLGEPGSLAPSEKADELWSYTARGATRSQLGSGKLLVPRKTYDLPEGATGAVTTLADGDLVVASQSALVRCDPAAMTSFTWSGTSRHLGRGPDADSVWASDGVRAVALVKLAGAAAKATVTHKLKDTETLIHLAGHGAYAAGVIAQGLGAGVTYALVVWTATGEAWRTSLGSDRASYFVAVDAKRVALVTRPAGALRSWAIASGKPL